MKDYERLELLYQYASELKFNDFNKLYVELTSELPQEELQDALLMKAQVKLFIADETLVYELERAECINTVPKFPCLINHWPCDCPNRMVVFNNSSESLKNLLVALPQIEKTMKRWYGEAGSNMVRQIHSEILYFSGRYQEAIDVAATPYVIEHQNHVELILQQCIMFRCYLAMGLDEKAQQAMLETINLSQTYPECVASYQSIREWANLTTGWSGETPRFQNEAAVLEDRLDAIRRGYSYTTHLEKFFIECAEKSYSSAYPMRRYYMDVFHALYWFEIEDYQQAEIHFMQAYDVSVNSGLVMAFVECGLQIVPLLNHIKDSGLDCDIKWLDQVVALAEQYESNLEKYRG